MNETKCLYCRQPVETRHERGVGTVWTHRVVDGWGYVSFVDTCRPTYAAPNFS